MDVGSFSYSKIDLYKSAYLFLILFINPAYIYANSGSPLVSFSLVHLLFLNALIGVFESSVVYKFGLDNKMFLIILGNYISMVFGIFLIAPYFSRIFGTNFWSNDYYYNHNFKGFFVGMAFAFIATLIIEFPFFYYSVKDKLKRKKVLVPFLIANLLSNIIMIILYYLTINEHRMY